MRFEMAGLHVLLGLAALMAYSAGTAAGWRVGLLSFVILFLGLLYVAYRLDVRARERGRQ